MTISRRKFITNIGAATLAAQLSSNAFAIAAKEYYADDFKIGAAIGGQILNGNAELEALLVREFNSISPENCLKWESLRTADGGWKWSDADKYVDLGMRNKMYIVGKCSPC